VEVMESPLSRMRMLRDPEPLPRRGGAVPDRRTGEVIMQGRFGEESSPTGPARWR